MDVKGILVFSFALCLASSGFGLLHPIELSASGNFINVMNFGAVGNGRTDDSQAFLKAWAQACASPSPSTLQVPPGKTFLLYPVGFQGPCKSPKINFQILGDILAPIGSSAWKGHDQDYWISFQSINGLTISGTGKINGQGSWWWQCRQSNQCPSAPTGVVVNSCNDFHMNGLTLINSPKFHIVLDSCIGVRISHIRITAPENSPNTDGIHIGRSKQIEIVDSNIGTGDDCISIGDETFNVHINKINCGPGHGISVGSLGRNSEDVAVEDIRVSNCQFMKTMNGARIKTWQGGRGFARNIAFENLSVNFVDNPIIIDQYYCDGCGEGQGNKTSAVKVSDISFIGVRGTSNTETAINLACSETVGCTNILLENVHLKNLASNKEAISYCLNANGTYIDVNPPLHCD